VKDLFHNSLNIKGVDVDEAYRIGEHNGKQHRSVKVSLTKISDVSRIIRRRRGKSDLIIHRDYPPEVAAKRKHIATAIKLARAEGLEAKHRGDHAIIDGIKVPFDQIQEAIKKYTPPVGKQQE
jgi:hypothetical protein